MKKFAVAVAVVLSASLAFAADPPLPGVSVDYHPNPAFVPRSRLHLYDATTPGVEQVGEVVILEGNDDIVSDDGMGGFGITDQPSVTRAFYAAYPDQFDEIVVFTTFDDAGQSGASAYEISARQDVQGIGRPVFDQSTYWGAMDHKLYAFVDMMRWDQFAYPGVPITNPGSYFYSVLGQEFAHRWLSFMNYTDGNGNVSGAMLGRDAAHWASTLQADASVMDGNRLVDNNDGTFSVTGSFSQYSPLDLYGMGLVPPADVPPWFLVTNAQTMDGHAIDPTRYLGRTSQFTGTREDITIDQVIAANGARVPAFADAPHAFRVAFVLLTRPGERAAQVVEIAHELDQARKVWEQIFSQYTQSTGTMCTQVSAPCGAPEAQIAGGHVDEAGGNKNGIPEPGEPVWLHLSLANPSDADAHAVVVSALGPIVGGQMDASLDVLAAGATTDVPFLASVPADAQCGVPITIEAQSVTGGNTFRGFVQFTPGLTTALADGFQTSGGHFDANAARTDTASANGWAWGVPSEYHANFGWQFQPPGGRDGGACWFTGLGQGHKPYTDSALGAGATTLWSRPIEASSLYQPALDYYVWWQAIDWTNPRNPTAIGDDPMEPNLANKTGFFVDVSVDGGQTWKNVDAIYGADLRWNARHVDLTPAMTGGKQTMVVRFTARNTNAAYTVEAGVDDVTLTTLTQACNPDAPPDTTVMPPAAAGGCGCALGAAAPASGAGAGVDALVLVLAALALVLAFVRRARR
jgi:hypothetical protein